MRISVTDPKKGKKKKCTENDAQKNRYLSNTKFSNKIDQYDQITKSANLEAQSVLKGPKIGGRISVSLSAKFSRIS
eukprot:SAG11_NODE_856_length_6864_cov_12.741168_11_plen_76_part_00